MRLQTWVVSPEVARGLPDDFQREQAPNFDKIVTRHERVSGNHQSAATVMVGAFTTTEFHQLREVDGGLRFTE